MTSEIQEFNKVINVLKNIKEGCDIERFKMTETEIFALNYTIEFMQKSID